MYEEYDRQEAAAEAAGMPMAFHKLLEDPTFAPAFRKLTEYCGLKWDGEAGSTEQLVRRLKVVVEEGLQAELERVPEEYLK